MGLVAALLLGVSCSPGVPLPEGNAFVRSLVGAQRQREEALYTYDVTEASERLDREGRARRRETRSYEVFHVKGRPGVAAPRDEGDGRGAQAALPELPRPHDDDHHDYRRFEVEVQEEVRP